MPRLAILLTVLVITTLFGRMTPVYAQILAVQTESRCPTADGWTYLSTPEKISQLDGNQSPGLYGPIAIGWSDTPVMYSAGLHRGLQRSNDCGRSWEAVRTGWSGVRGIAVDQLGQIQIVFYQGTLALSPDGGGTWNNDTRVFYQGDTVGSVAYAFAIAISPRVPGQAYGHILPYAGRRGHVLARTADSGATWHVLQDGFPGGLPLVDPVHDLLYVVRDEDSLWQIDLSSYDFRPDPVAKLPTAIAAHTMSADGRRHWIATHDGKLYRSLDRGLKWESLNNAPGVGLWRHLAASHTDPGVFFAVAADGGIWMYREPSVKMAPAQVP